MEINRDLPGAGFSNGGKEDSLISCVWVSFCHDTSSNDLSTWIKVTCIEKMNNGHLSCSKYRLAVAQEKSLRCLSIPSHDE